MTFAGFAGSFPGYWMTISFEEQEPTLLEHFHFGKVKSTESIVTQAHTVQSRTVCREPVLQGGVALGINLDSLGSLDFVIPNLC